MTPTRQDGQRVLLTQSDQFMGPALASTFEAQGATVIADTRALHGDPAAPSAAVQAAGHVDVLPPMRERGWPVQRCGGVSCGAGASGQRGVGDATGVVVLGQSPPSTPAEVTAKAATGPPHRAWTPGLPLQTRDA